MNYELYLWYVNEVNYLIHISSDLEDFNDTLVQYFLFYFFRGIEKAAVGVKKKSTLSFFLDFVMQNMFCCFKFFGKKLLYYNCVFTYVTYVF